MLDRGEQLQLISLTTWNIPLPEVVLLEIRGQITRISFSRQNLNQVMWELYPGV